MGHLATVYRELCEITHFGTLGMWAAYVMDNEEERRFGWTSAPRFRNETALVACGQLDELTTMMERAMHLLGRTMLAEHGFVQPAASTSHDGLERSETPPSQPPTHPLQGHEALAVGPAWRSQCRPSVPDGLNAGESVGALGRGCVPRVSRLVSPTAGSMACSSRRRTTLCCLPASAPTRRSE